MTVKNYQFRLIVRPTTIGKAIIDRLEAEGVDRTSESRRWLELGFAAEQAGFRLDGTELRFADRAWDSQPLLPARSAPASSSSPALHLEGLPPPSSLTAAATTSAVAESPPVVPAARPAIADSALGRNLRGLSAS